MSGITFGTPAAANPSTSFALGGGFGNPSSSGGGFSFGGFGASSAGGAITSTTTSLGTGFSFGGASQTTTTSTSAAPLSFGGFGGSALTTSGTSSLFSNQSTLTTSSTLNTGGGLKPTNQAPASTPLWGGLGGSDSKSPIKSGLGTKTNEVKGVKDNVVPPEILATVEELSKHVKAQKLVRESIARMTSRPLFKVEDDLKELRQQLHEVATMLQRNSVGIEKLKKEATQELKHVEISQRTKETPPGLQYENVQPAEYFQRLVEDFERQMAQYRQQFFDAEKFFASINHSSASNPSELLAVFTKLNEGFISLAAKLQVVHESVKNLKENYAQFRKRHFCDGSSDIFRRTPNGRPGGSVAPTPAKDFTTFGPSPFSYGSGVSSVAFSSALDRSSTSMTANQNQSKADCFDATSPIGRQQQFRQGSGVFLNSAIMDPGGFGSAVHPAPSTSASAGTSLQRPGNKRGKNA